MSGSARQFLIQAGRIGLLLAICAGAELGMRYHWLNPIFFSSPSQVFDALRKQLDGGTLLGDMGATFFETIAGLGAGSLLGLIVGLALPQLGLVSRIFEPFLMTLNGVPVIVIAPLFVLWLGIGLFSKIGISVYIVFFSMFIPVYTGSIRLERELVDAVHVMGASRWQIFRKVILPSAMPSVYTGLKIGTGLALVGAVIGEFVASRNGLGHLILYASGTLDTPTLYLGIIVLAGFAAALTGLVNALGPILVRWRFMDEK